MGGHAMIKREIALKHYEWTVHLYIGYTEAESIYLCQRLAAIGCRGKALSDAHAHFVRGGEDRGLTYSNINERNSVVAIGASETEGSIVNTIGHELLHVVAHICEKESIDMFSEEPCYILGELCEKLFKELR